MPTLGFETSDDWTYERSYFEQDGGFLANSIYGEYTVYTNNSGSATYDIKYKHGLNLCAGTSYDVSGWVESYRPRQNANRESCRITAFLDGQQAFTERLGWADYLNYRYLHGVITPTADTDSSELYFRVECPVPQAGLNPRGLK